MASLSLDALRRIKEAFRQGRWQVYRPHAEKRMQQRSVTYVDIKHAVLNAASIRSYVPDRDRSGPGVSHSRVSGTDLEGETLEVGCDLYADHLGPHVLVTTVF